MNRLFIANKHVNALLIAAGLAACSELPEVSVVNAEQTTIQSPTQTHSYSEDVVWAINIAGQAYTGTDGIHYEADNLALISQQGESDQIKGSQDAPLYRNYRMGDIQIAKPMDNGLYAVTLKFAEPGAEVGDRLIDVYLQEQLRIAGLDIRLARDGQPNSSLDRTIKGVAVTNGMLNIALKGQNMAPVLHAIVVRKMVDQSAGWQLIWQDEFDYQGAPDPTKWSFDEWPARKVNDEDQAYTNRAKNVRVEDNKLIIEAHKEAFDNAEYTSGRIHTLGKLDLHYGKIDVRAKLPAGQGTWSAIWMLPSDPYRYSTSCQPGEDWQGSTTCDAWPNSGEIDIMEHVGYDMNIVHGTVHNKAYYWMNWEQRKASIEGESVADEFHVYSVEWTPEHVIISMDDVPYFFYLNEQTDWRAWPFDHPYHLILNLAIGGAWGRAGGPIDNEIFPVQMEVDYVRVFKSLSAN